jgi:hypothetical protein
MVSDFEKRKEDRWATRRDAEERLDHRHLKKFKREIREAILLLVNQHGVEYRLQADGQHIFLYSGVRGERPFKIAAMRPVNKQMGFLVPWVREHFPHVDLASGKVKGETAYGIHLFEPNSDEPPKCKVCGFEREDGRAEHIAQDEGTSEGTETDPTIEPTFWANKTVPQSGYIGPVPEDAAHPVEEEQMEVPTPKQVFDPEKREQEFAEALEGDPDPFVQSQEKARQHKETVDSLAAQGWEWYTYPTAGPSEFFMVKGDELRCTAVGCGYAKTGSFAGVHMHEAHHTGKAEEMRLLALETKRTKAEQQAAMLAETLDILLRPHGYVAVRREDVQWVKEAQALREERDRLQAELNELQAKFDLAREAFGL